MSKYDRDIQDVYAVKQLGDAIGYGHLMAIAHELWARHLESKGLPRSGAHCVVGYPMVKEQYQAEALNDRIYTIIVDKALEADRKTENSSEIPNNCEDLQDWKDRMWAEAIVTEPTISKMEQVEDEFKQFDREDLVLLIECQKERIAELLAKDEPTWEQVKEYCNKRCLDIVDSAMRKQWYKDEPQTDCAWK